MTGPLAGVRVIELGGIGPGPFTAMQLADHGAEVIRIDRRGFVPGPLHSMLRSRKMVQLDLKREDDVATLLTLVGSADVLIEGFRPGTAERLGLGPDRLCALYPRLVYARVTGWGQTGDLAERAGHDIDYIAMTGALAAIGPAERPIPPLALLGDMGGGATLAFAICAALLHARSTGIGQCIDHAMIDSASLMLTAFHELQAVGDWTVRREANLLDGGAPHYGVYETADARFVAIGALEPQFYAVLLDVLGLTGDPLFAAQEDRQAWPAMRQRLSGIFRQQSRDAWCAVFDGRDACFAPVLDLTEARSHPTAILRGAFVEVGGIMQPAPMPRYSATPLETPFPPVTVKDPKDLLP